jgi:hypothetical protein
MVWANRKGCNCQDILGLFKTEELARERVPRWKERVPDSVELHVQAIGVQNLSLQANGQKS